MNFFVDSIYNNYSIDMGEISLGWAGELREFDFYVNGTKIGSTFGDENFIYSSKLGKNTFQALQDIPVYL